MLGVPVAGKGEVVRSVSDSGAVVRRLESGKHVRSPEALEAAKRSMSASGEQRSVPGERGQGQGRASGALPTAVEEDGEGDEDEEEDAEEDGSASREPSSWGGEAGGSSSSRGGGAGAGAGVVTAAATASAVGSADADGSDGVVASQLGTVSAHAGPGGRSVSDRHSEMYLGQHKADQIMSERKRSQEEVPLEVCTEGRADRSGSRARGDSVSESKRLGSVSSRGGHSNSSENGTTDGDGDGDGGGEFGDAVGGGESLAGGSAGEGSIGSLRQRLGLEGAAIGLGVETDTTTPGHRRPAGMRRPTPGVPRSMFLESGFGLGSVRPRRGSVGSPAAARYAREPKRIVP